LDLIRELEADRAKTLEEAEAADPVTSKIIALQRIRAIGENFAAVLVRKVFYRSFANRRQLASYVGITPMPYRIARWHHFRQSLPQQRRFILTAGQSRHTAGHRRRRPCRLSPYCAR
jgi:transposase